MLITKFEEHAMFEVPFRVDYVDTDAMGVVHHSSYCRWLERARILWLDSIDESYKKLEAEGLGLPLREMEVKFRMPLRFDDQALVVISNVEMDAFTIEIHYRITTEDRARIYAMARTKHVLVRMERLAGSEGVRFERLDVPENWRLKWQQLKDQK